MSGLACPRCDAAVIGPLVSDVDGSVEYVCQTHGSVAPLHDLHVARDLTVAYDGVVIGRVERVRHNTYSAIAPDGEVVAANCYANGGAKHCAAFYLAIRTGAMRDGDVSIHSGPKGREGGGPYTYRANGVD